MNAAEVYLGMRAVLPGMMERRAGSIVDISSIAGLRGAGTAFAYGTSKWAVRGMTRAAAIELAPFRVRSNSVHRGIIETPWPPSSLPLAFAKPGAPVSPTAARRPPKKSPRSSYSSLAMTARTGPAASPSLTEV